MTKAELKERRIAVLMGGISSERDVSLRSGAAVLGALTNGGYDAVGIDVNNDIGRELELSRAQVAFVALHGRWGEDGIIQGVLEMMKIPYTGPGVLGSAAALDKAVMKYILRGRHIPTPPYAVVRKGEPCPFPLPFVAKPAREGSTIGISVVREEKEIKRALETAFRYDKTVFVEKVIKGREITVGMVNGMGLPVVEVKPSSGFYDYEAKYTKGMTEYIVPARISAAITHKAAALAADVYDAFDLSGCVRTDMLIDRGIRYVIDINTSPGMTETSLVPKAWAHQGGTFTTLVEEILTGAGLKG